MIMMSAKSSTDITRRRTTGLFRFANDIASLEDIKGKIILNVEIQAYQRFTREGHGKRLHMRIS